MNVVGSKTGEALDAGDSGDGHGRRMVDWGEDDDFPMGDPGFGTGRGALFGVVEDVGDFLDRAQCQLLAELLQTSLEI